MTSGEREKIRAGICPPGTERSKMDYIGNGNRRKANMNEVTAYTKSDEQFYPTPPEIAEKMLDGIDLRFVGTVLEPSAGKGDLLTALAKKYKIYSYSSYGNESLDVDCIEIDPYLREILKYNFSEERKQEIEEEIDTIKKKRTYDYEAHEYTKLSFEDEIQLLILEEQEREFFTNGIHVVHDDFLTYQAYKHYDLILMNPPFADGDRHLLKALDIQKRGGGIVCLLNAETLRNPYTQTRRDLLTLLNKYGAEVKYIDDAFKTAERRANVDVAIVKVNIPEEQETSDIFERLKEAENYEEFDPEATELTVSDYIKAAIAGFNLEVKAGLELIRQYKALTPYIMNSLDKNNKYASAMLTLKTGRDRDAASENEYVKSVRCKYWTALLHNPKFTDKLTSKLQNEYRERVGKLIDYDFTEFNISVLSAEMNSKIKTGIENEIIAMFDRLTEEHSYYPEFSKNRHYYNGWKTNKAHKIGKKVILPCHGVFSEWSDRLDTHDAAGTLSDIEKILNFLDGNMTAEVDLWNTIQRHFDTHTTKNIPLKFFTVTFYKKGTVHITFTNPELIERFNIYAAQQKNWLPPSYGKKAYKDMDEEEKTVIDSFQGEKAYNNVMQKTGYYLAPVTENNVLKLTA